MRYLLLTILALAFSCARAEERAFRDEAQEQQFHQLLAELRCPVCQNSNIAESSSTIAVTMRDKVYELMLQGQTQQEIVDYMVARFGQFVTWQPPVTPVTIWLWLLPAGVTLGGCVYIWRRAKRREETFAEKIAQPAEPILPPLAGRVLLPGIIAAAAMAVGVYLLTGGWQQTMMWQQAVGQTSSLLKQYRDPSAAELNEEQRLRLVLGLRTRLQTHAADPAGWALLGTLAEALNNPPMAKEAFRRAWRSEPENSDYALNYIQTLLQSGEQRDNQLGDRLLSQQLRNDHTSLRGLGLLAFRAFEQQRFAQAVAAWEMMLSLLPDEDPRRAVVQQSITLAKRQAIR